MSSSAASAGTSPSTLPDEHGHFGQFGGRFMPEALIAPLDELERAWREAKVDPTFTGELDRMLREYANVPSPLYEASRLSERAGARILLKREDLNHTGAHKIRNVLGQALLTRRMGKRRVIAETGAGQHGVATATACAYLDLECVVYMGEVDTERQALNVARMQMLGATVVPVTTGSRTLKDAINEALRDWVGTVDDTHYLLGTAAGAHPFPEIVRDLVRGIGDEARARFRDADEIHGQHPVVLCRAQRIGLRPGPGIKLCRPAGGVLRRGRPIAVRARPRCPEAWITRVDGRIGRFDHRDRSGRYGDPRDRRQLSRPEPGS